MAVNNLGLTFWRRWLVVSLALLPYASYLGLVGAGIALLTMLGRFRRLALDVVTRNGLLLLSGLLILSALFAHNRAEAFLQLANFLPFFLMFGLLPYLMPGVAELEHIAVTLVVTALPINLLSLGEYLLKSPRLPIALRQIPFVAGLRSEPYKGRAMVMFDHPNALAGYLVLVLGLGLGLVLQRSLSSKIRTLPISDRLLYIATFLNLVGIFCSGSRNGLILAVIQVLLFSFLVVRANRRMLLLGLLGLLVVLGSATFLGIGGRTLLPAAWSNDPRLTIWRVAVQMIGDRPWLGWGLGNYKFVYRDYLTPALLRLPRFRQISHPHNFWLMMGSEAGILAMLLITLIVGYICFRAVQQMRFQMTPEDRAILVGYLLAFLGCIGFALFDVTYYDSRSNVLNWVILGGIYSGARLSPLLGGGDRPPA